MIGETVSHYEILEKLGEGGMGIVYKAHDTSLNRKVALKFLPPHLTKDASTRKRFMVEAQAASALDHPNICNIHEIGETNDGQLFICMACYDGESLRDKINKGPIPIEESFRILSQIAQGLKAAHDKNIIHRDIKPGNILLTENGDVKIVDFGLAKLAGMDLTKTTSSKGTAAYMCPEQIRGQKVDHRGDIWALGIVFYEMLTGYLPFEAEYPEPMMYAIVNEEPKPLSYHLTNVSGSIQAIIDKLLKKDPNERYANMSEVLNDFKTQIKTDDIEVIKTRSIFTKLFNQNRILVYVSIIVLLLLFYFIRTNYLTDQVQGNKIAVLPVETMVSDTSDLEWFNDGMTDELITKLAQISGLRVISRSSSMQYKGTSKSTPQIASELNINYIVEPTIVKVENQIKINTKLIDAIEDEIIWVKEFENELKNILTLQGQLAIEIANQIQVELTPQEKTRLSENREVDPEIYVMYMKGMYHLNKRTPENLKKGISLLEQAVEKDPNEPLAQAGLSLGYSIMAHTPKPLPGTSKLCRDAALKALELNANLAEAHLALAMVKIYGDKDIEGAGQSYRNALDLNPNLSLAIFHYAFYEMLVGNLEEGPRLLKRAIELDPVSNMYPAELAWTYYFHKEYDKTIEYAQRSLELVPDFPFALFVLGEGYAGKGMFDKAIEVQKKSAELAPYHEFGLAHTYGISGNKNAAISIAEKIEKRNEIWDTWCLAVIYAGIGDADKTFYWLEQAYEWGHPYVLWLRRNTYFDAYKDDPRYKNLAQRLNLPK